MVLGMPLMAPGGHAGHLTSADPFMRWTMTALGPWLQAMWPGSTRCRQRSSPGRSLVATAAVMAWAGRELLRARLDERRATAPPT